MLAFSYVFSVFILFYPSITDVKNGWIHQVKDSNNMEADNVWKSPFTNKFFALPREKHSLHPVSFGVSLFGSIPVLSHTHTLSVCAYAVGMWVFFESGALSPESTVWPSFPVTRVCVVFVVSLFFILWWTASLYTVPPEDKQTVSSFVWSSFSLEGPSTQIFVLMCK